MFQMLQSVYSALVSCHCQLRERKGIRPVKGCVLVYYCYHFMCVIRV